MELNKSHFEFKLTESGWHEVKVEKMMENEGKSDCMAILRVTEFSHDNKPDIWYKPEIVHLCESEEDRIAARKHFKKYGLPALLKLTCWADLDALRDAIKKGLDDEDLF